MLCKWLSSHLPDGNSVALAWGWTLLFISAFLDWICMVQPSYWAQGNCLNHFKTHKCSIDSNGIKWLQFSSMCPCELAAIAGFVQLLVGEASQQRLPDVLECQECAEFLYPVSATTGLGQTSQLVGAVPAVLLLLGLDDDRHAQWSLAEDQKASTNQ